MWDVVTSTENYSWRSDLSKIERVSEKQFIEYTRDGFVTQFTVTAAEPYRLWRFDMDNENMYGHWSGVFSRSDEGTKIIFTEDVTAKKLIIKPFVKAFLKKQQKLYVDDLKKALGE